MPRSAISAETAYYILSPENIAKNLVNISNHPELSVKQIKNKKIEPAEKEEISRALTRLAQLDQSKIYLFWNASMPHGSQQAKQLY